MNKPPRFGKERPQQALFNKGERNRLIAMSVLLVVVLVVFFGSLMQKGKYEDPGNADLPAEEFREQVVVPEFDRSLVAGQVDDDTEGDRVLLESAPFDALFAFASDFGQGVFLSGAGGELDAEAYEALLAAPEEHRAAPFRIRGYVAELKQRTRPDGLSEHRGWLQLDDGRHASFAVEEFPERSILGDYVRVDGFFLKHFRDELEERWVEGPLFVGKQAVRSFPAPAEAFDERRLTVVLAQVSDDSVESMTKLDDAALEGEWLLMDLARRPDAAESDWDAVPEIDNLLLAEIHKNGHEFRGKPLRIPVSRNMDAWTFDPGENPVRIDAITEGWIGNMTWTSQTGLIKFRMPRYAPELQDAKYVTGRGYFLKNLAYEPAEGGVQVVPYFVMQTVEPFFPPRDTSIDKVFFGVLGLTLFLVALIPILLLRDRRRSHQLQEELVRRRQERRRRQGEAPAVNPPS